MGNDAAECVVQPNWVQHFSASTEWSPPSPTPILIPEEPQYSAGIGHRLESKEVLDEGIDLSQDR
jgi:hypothetical protein